MKISILGKGNVGTHLYKAFAAAENTECHLLNSHRPQGIDSSSDLILISVSDRAIHEVAVKLQQEIPGFEGVVAHTAGSVSIESIGGLFANYGVFYPLQTFSKNDVIDYSKIPIFIEGNNEKAIKTLESAALKMSQNLYRADSQQRAMLHLSSVFACNFSNALCSMAEEILRDSPFDIKVLLPLLEQTVAKLQRLSPLEAQTGPAKREDREVMEQQLKKLEKAPEIQNIYSSISKYIISKNNQE